MSARGLALLSAIACSALTRAAYAEAPLPPAPNTALMLQAAAGAWPYVGVSGLATLRTGRLALGTEFSWGFTFENGRAWEALGGVGYGAAGRDWEFTAMPVAGFVKVKGVAVDNECGSIGLGRCNSGVNATAPFLGLRVQTLGRHKHFIAGVLFGLDYTLHDATETYTKCAPPIAADGACPVATAHMTRVLLTAELSFGGSMF